MAGFHKRQEHFLFALFLTLTIAPAVAHPPINLSRLASPPLAYSCPYAGRQASIRCDGLTDEPAWKNVPWTSAFQDIEGPEQPAPYHSTRVRMVWDDEALYVAAELTEPDLWATLRNHDDIIFRDNDFEVFISGDPSDSEYYEVEVNAFNTVFDLLLPRPYRDKGIANIPWNLNGLQTGVHLTGTINQPGDRDNGWTVEMKIPFRGLALQGNGKSPVAGDRWRINFSRVEYDITTEGTSYRKIKYSSSGKDLPERNWVWSPQGIIDMHFPERWGYLYFQKETSPVQHRLTLNDSLEQCLWLTAYAQRLHFRTYREWLREPTPELSNLLQRLQPKGFDLKINEHPSGWAASITHRRQATVLTLDANGNLTEWKSSTAKP